MSTQVITISANTTTDVVVPTGEGVLTQINKLIQNLSPGFAPNATDLFLGFGTIWSLFYAVFYSLQ
jgi:hypothetical protein